MILGHEMFAIAPATGHAHLLPEQSSLLVGKARWIHAAHLGGLPTAPTIAVSRAAWMALQDERREGRGQLRAQWVGCLFKLVGRAGAPVRLVVRTSALQHSAGLMPARLDLQAPLSEADSVDEDRPLGRAIAEAFASYRTALEADGDPDGAAARRRQIVLVQTLVPGSLLEFATRDPQSGEIGPVALPGDMLPPLPSAADAIVALLERAAGRHMSVLAALQKNALVFVSARPLQASAGAELEAAVDRVTRGVWSPGQAVAHVDASHVTQLLHPRLKPGAAAQHIAAGLGVSPGAASGIVVFTSEDAARVRARGKHCILVVSETGPNDIEGMRAATGILTARGGMTSHAAVIARITGKPCVAGVRTLFVDASEMTCRIGEREFRAGDRLTIDGSDGSVYSGALPLSRPHMGGALGTLLGWSDGTRRIAVRTNVETVEAARTALSFGAEGIGLARSEHMFFSPERMVALRRLILSESEDDRKAALKGLVDYQTGDYSALFSTMQGRPVTVRLFDPPLHEFLPRSDEDIEETAQSLSLGVRALRNRLERLEEVNPMLGHRGVRLAITYPEILEMQMQALVAGVRDAAARQSEAVTVEVMVPFVSTAREVAWVRDRVMALVEYPRLGERALFSFGTMIELPRAALRAGDIAQAVDFFSFGTNDLTQTTYGISRDDAPAFLAAYQRMGLYDHDPFVTLDSKGVGELISIAITRGKASNPALKIGICGEHAGDPASLRFFAGLDIDYISCSPYRVPVARLALAQAGMSVSA